MADLVEASTWAGIRQIETTDPVVGGAPNVGTGAGMSNIPHKQLADRTLFLKNQIDGAGTGVATVGAINNLDTLTKGGHYAYAAASTGAPLTTAGTVIHLAGTIANEATQIAINLAGDRNFFRRRLGGVWQAWVEIWAGLQATSSLAANGWQRLPSGLILQWGATGSSVSNGGTITWPITFPNACFSASLTDVSAATAGTAHVVSVNTVSVTGATVGVVRHDGDTGASSTLIQYLAIGN
jgi:hypothetical protein